MVTVEQRLFREMGAGGYSGIDHRMEYIVRVNALLRPDMRVMEFGAGRGKWSDDPVPLRRHLGDFRGAAPRSSPATSTRRSSATGRPTRSG
ncbi:hypothetical protein ACU4GA_15795 [Methylobacterium oryzae CBMB20]